MEKDVRINKNFFIDYNIERFAGMYLHPRLKYQPTIVLFRTGSYQIMGGKSLSLCYRSELFVKKLIDRFEKKCTNWHHSLWKGINTDVYSTSSSVHDKLSKDECVGVYYRRWCAYLIFFPQRITRTYISFDWISDQIMCQTWYNLFPR